MAVSARKAYAAYASIAFSGKEFYCLKADGTFTKWNDRIGAVGAKNSSECWDKMPAEVLTEKQAKKRGII